MNTMVRVVEDHKAKYPHLLGVVYADDTLAKIKESLSAQIKMKYESKFRKWLVDMVSNNSEGLN